MPTTPWTDRLTVLAANVRGLPATGQHASQHRALARAVAHIAEQAVCAGRVAAGDFLARIADGLAGLAEAEPWRAMTGGEIDELAAALERAAGYALRADRGGDAA